MGALIEAALIASFKITTSLPQALVNSLLLYEAVLVAITARDPDGARRAMEQLLQDSWELLLRAFNHRTPAHSAAFA